jgi:putative transposase
MSVARRRERIEPQHPVLSVARQCALVGISRSAFDGPANGESPLNLALMRLIDARFLETPWVTEAVGWPAISGARAMSSGASACGG